MVTIGKSWGKWCDKLIFAIDDHDVDGPQKEVEFVDVDGGQVIKVPIKSLKQEPARDCMWEKVWRFLVWLEDKYHGEYDFLLRADFDTWFSVNNFKSWAKYYNPNYSWFMGLLRFNLGGSVKRVNGKVEDGLDWFFIQGGSWTLSRRAIERVVDLFYTDEFLQNPATEGRECSAGIHSSEEDQLLAVCLRSLGVSCSCTHSMNGDRLDVFCCFSLGIYPLNTQDEHNKIRWSSETVTNTIKDYRKGSWPQNIQLCCSQQYVHVPLHHLLFIQISMTGIICWPTTSTA